MYRTLHIAYNHKLGGGGEASIPNTISPPPKTNKILEEIDY